MPPFAIKPDISFSYTIYSAMITDIYHIWYLTTEIHTEGVKMKSFFDVFEKVKEHIREEKLVSETGYKLWIDNIKPVRMVDNVAYFEVQTSFHKDILVNNYLSVIKEAFAEMLGFDVEIELDVIPEITETDDENTHEELVESFKSAEYEYTFYTFIVGPSNEFAYAACMAIAKNKGGSQYNPLFIYGPSGLGKTHLLSAIQYEIKRNHPECNIVYVTSEFFTNEIITAIRENNTSTFRQKYRTADILLIDDVQFIVGKESTQEEFFHTFNELLKSGSQIVLTSDRPPKDIKTLEDRIRNRFEAGLIADVSLPNFETRVAIIKRKAELLNLHIPDEVADFMANKLKSNIRQLEGAVKKMKASEHYMGTPPTMANAQHVIRDILTDDQPAPITVERIINEVAGFYNVTPEDIRSKKRLNNISMARKVAIYCVREITGMPLVTIGTEFGGRDHSTMLYSYNNVSERMQKDQHMREIIQDIINNITQSR